MSRRTSFAAATAMAVLILTSALAAAAGDGGGVSPGRDSPVDVPWTPPSPLAVPSGYTGHRPLLELFTGLSCPSCMNGPHQDIEGLYESIADDESVPWTYVGFHELNGGGVDGLATAESRERMRHYQPGVSGTPDAEIDGGWHELGGMYGKPTPNEANARGALSDATTRYEPTINPRQPVRSLIPDFRYVNLEVEQYYQDGEWAVIVKVDYLGMGRIALNRPLNGDLYVFMVEDNVVAWSTVEDQMVNNRNVFRGYAIAGQNVQMSVGDPVATFSGVWAVPNITVDPSQEYPEGTPVPVKAQDITAIAAIFDRDDTDSANSVYGNPNAVPRCIQSATPASTAYDRGNRAEPVGDIRVTDEKGGIRVEASVDDPDGASTAVLFWSEEGPTSPNWSAVVMGLQGGELCDDTGACYAYTDATATATIHPGDADQVWLVVLYTDGKGALARSDALEHDVGDIVAGGGGTGLGGSWVAVLVLAVILALLGVEAIRTKDPSARKAVAAMMVVVLVMGSFVIASGVGSSGSGAERAPDIAFTDLDGNDLELRDFRGKVVVLDLMATWCPDCRKAMKDLREVHEQYGDRIEMITIDIDPKETPQQLQAFKEEYKAGWRFAMDNGDQDFFKEFSVKLIPRTIIIDPRGRVTFSAEGAVPAKDLGKAIDEAASGAGGIVSLGSSATSAAGLLIWAVGLGAFAFFSPCSWPMLPGYMTYYMRLKDARNTRKALKGGMAAAAGLVSVYMLVAVLVGAFGSAISKHVYVLEPIVGAMLILMAIIIFTEISLGNFVYYLQWPVRKGLAFSRVVVGRLVRRGPIGQVDAPVGAIEQAAQEGGFVGLFTYGVGYAAASTGCMAPVIIALVFLAAAQATFLGAVLIFLVFALTAATLMVVITMAVGYYGGKLSRRWTPSPTLVRYASSLLLLAVGFYIITYYFMGLA